MCMNTADTRTQVRIQAQIRQTSITVLPVTRLCPEL
jgi:hypothetical protein